jgi:cytochrome c oxidase subunit 3
MSSAVAHAHPSEHDISKFGMWLFLASEIMFFAGFIAAYVVLRTSDVGGVFKEGQHHLNRVLAAVNTVVLIFSSLTMALAVRAAKLGQNDKVRMHLVITFLCGLAFMVIKFVEYKAKFDVGHTPSYNLFYGTYFTLTGFHGLHVLFGMLALGILIAISKQFTPQWNTPVEVTGLYWHLVDLVWIFLFPMLYLF